MAEASVGRALRDGSLEGEHAVALSLRDSLSCPLGTQVFGHFFRGLAPTSPPAGPPPGGGLVLVALDRSPSLYLDLLKSGGLNCVGSGVNWFRVLDCYSDPLGWKARLPSSLRLGGDASVEELQTLFTDVKDVDRLLSLVLDLGRGMVGEGKRRFAVAVDSVSALLRRASLQSVASFISNLRGHGQVSTVLWLLQSDLHESRICAAFDYISTMVVLLEGGSNLEQNFRGGRFHLRMKRRNGRVKVLVMRRILVETAGVKFFSTPLSESKIAEQTLLPKLQFNLQLSEKERMDREKVVLPFEHQGNGKAVRIYDGRRSTEELGPTGGGGGGKGEIHYVRDSDDEELPDSDEDPDDDLDI
ncbi:unnamed protein product [Spirodela intermedia]|uniref:Elongator complex protein 5 n=1 Tax=Spirodela intermedia TaxID=51605 RepID=A0A7I8JSQ6_SPIIN|nr:unnamed protein product [Spirodela intermedia]CAA6673208.1 unnamed protein product [Spirodela intermedia]